MPTRLIQERPNTATASIRGPRIHGVRRREKLAEKRQERRDIWSALSREFRSPSFLIHNAILFSSPFWLTAAVYFYLWTFQAMPNGAIAWGAIAIFTVIFVVGSAYFCHLAVRHGKRLRRLRLRARIGYPGAEDEYAGAKRSWRRNLRTAPISIALSAMTLCIAPAVSLELWQSMQGPEIVSIRGHKPRAITPQTQLRVMLYVLKKRGLLTPLTSGSSK